MRISLTAHQRPFDALDPSDVIASSSAAAIASRAETSGYVPTVSADEQLSASQWVSDC
jgi:hypothetical protein